MNNEKCKEEFDVKTAKGAMKALKIIGMVILGIGFAILLGFVVMWLWNWLMPMIFGLTKLTYWQAIGIAILGNIIFGRFGGHGSDDSGKSKSRKHGIRSEIKSEIGKEIRKEFEKEFHKEKGKNVSDDNDNYDDLYEKWWAKEGEKNFDEYMKNPDSNQ